MCNAVGEAAFSNRGVEYVTSGNRICICFQKNVLTEKVIGCCFATDTISRASALNLSPNAKLMNNTLARVHLADAKVDEYVKAYLRCCQEKQKKMKDLLKKVKLCEHL